MRQLEQNLVPAAATSITKLVRTLENNHVKKILVKTILNKSIVNVHLKKNNHMNCKTGVGRWGTTKERAKTYQNRKSQ